jgi:hypothetical protein
MPRSATRRHVAAALVAFALLAPAASRASAPFHTWTSSSAGWKTVSFTHDAPVSLMFAGSAIGLTGIGLYVTGDGFPTPVMSYGTWLNDDASVGVRIVASEGVEVDRSENAAYGSHVAAGISYTINPPGTHTVAVWTVGRADPFTLSLTTSGAANVTAEDADDTVWVARDQDFDSPTKAWARLQGQGARVTVDARYGVASEATMLGIFAESYPTSADADFGVATPKGDLTCEYTTVFFGTRQCYFSQTSFPLFAWRTVADGPGAYTFHATGAGAGLHNFYVNVADVRLP